ncbi:uncharacterized protein BDZ99DRAFT_537988 [Mytilinidion resinicola]|uniref:RING-type domain-containing protein n=1 Tax=Mytilinidion resinicola TaxID=574789 RepID=A0A6A6YDT7_9PEZI|nr:uncharacterized protein BDZ99DRAFT_537988 [Mytilinidion resinicola]KAF2806991.1 hypothetical protein BDZ99DRAFT_537988 [Mytilinidion resinicola]
METANRKMWMQCRSCKHMVELETGCYHMTCRCGAQFCYLCGSTWKTCSCPQFEERGLLGDMRQRRSSAAPLIRLATPDLPTPERAPSVAVSGPEDAECEHNWYRRYSKHGANTTCELCVNTNRLRFINECRLCDRRLCLRCINNRI